MRIDVAKQHLFRCLNATTHRYNWRVTAQGDIARAFSVAPNTERAVYGALVGLSAASITKLPE